MAVETSTNKNSKIFQIISLASIAVSASVFIAVSVIDNDSKKTVIENELTNLNNTAVVTESDLVNVDRKPILPAPPKTHSKNITEYPGVTPKELEVHFARNLEGTEIDGELKIDENGDLVIDLAVKDFFDYFLSSVAEVPVEVALDQMFNIVDSSLPPEAATEVRALLDNYLSYKEAALDLMAQPMLPREQQTKDYQLQVMEDSLAQMRSLRRDNMPENQVDAFFGLEEAYEEYTLANIRIQFDEQLSSQEKATLMQYHRTQLPEVIRGTEERFIADGEKSRLVQEAMANPDNSQLINRMNDYGYTEEQQAEVISFKTQQEDFNRRYSEYAKAKQERLVDIEQRSDKELALENLRSEFFDNEQELTQARVRDLDS